MQTFLTKCTLLTKSLVLPVLTIAMLTVSNASADIVVYTNDFSTSAGPEWSDNTRSTQNGETYLGGSNGFGAGTNSLTLTGLASHDTVTVFGDVFSLH